MIRSVLVGCPVVQAALDVGDEPADGHGQDLLEVHLADEATKSTLSP